MAEKFLGFPYPIIKHPRGYFHTQFGIEQIKSDMLSLLLTDQGERVMMPNYGCSLNKFLFEPNDSVLINQIYETIAEQLSLFEPRVVIQQIDVNVAPDNEIFSNSTPLEEREQILLIRILFFDPEQIQEVEELKLEVPLPTNI